MKAPSSGLTATFSPDFGGEGTVFNQKPGFGERSDFSESIVASYFGASPYRLVDFW